MQATEMGYGDRLITGVGANRIRPVRQTGCRTDKAGEWAGLKLNRSARWGDGPFGVM